MTCSRITFEVPVVTKNPTNQREHHTARHKRATGQRDATHLLCGPGGVARRCWWCERRGFGHWRSA